MITHKPFSSLIEHIIKSNFTGYDPYDGANTKYKIIQKNKLMRLFFTYFNKFSPFNFRPLFGIKPSMQNQAIAFIGKAMLTVPDTYCKEIDLIAMKLINESMIDLYGYHCWDAHGFSIQLRAGSSPVGMTDIIGNEAIARFFMELYKRDQKPLYRELCLSVRDFFLNELSINYHGIHFFKYKPITPSHQWCYNASAIAASYVAAASNFFRAPYDKAFTENCLRDVVIQQKESGAWYYSRNLLTGYEKPQIDFHQGFILDALLEYMTLYGFAEPFNSAYRKGLSFYRQKQFLHNGQGIYRYPRKWPVNIHNQAQGIITFMRAAEAGFGQHYGDFARTISEWTIRHMQDPDGHFYYLKYPFLTNKIPYIRWSDAAMAYALSVL